MADTYSDVVDEETLEYEWEESEARLLLESIVENGRDKGDDGSNRRADQIYKSEVFNPVLKHFPQKFVTKKLQKLRKSRVGKEDGATNDLWEGSRAKVVLERLVENGFDCDDQGKPIAAGTIYNMRDEFSSFPKHFFASKLKDAQKAKPKPPSWMKSRAREILCNIIAVGFDKDERGIDLPVSEVYAMDDEFKRHPLKQFAKRLEELRESIGDLVDRAQRDSTAVKQFLEINTPSLMDAERFNYDRYPKWQGSEAQRLLRDDLVCLARFGVDNVAPRELWEYREVYQDFPLSVFRNHIYKELIHDKQVKWNKHQKKKKMDELK